MPFIIDSFNDNKIRKNQGIEGIHLCLIIYNLNFYKFGIQNKQLNELENLLSLDFAGITVGNGVFLIGLIFAFNGVYRMVQKFIKRRPVQLTYTLSLLFTLTTLALTACCLDNSAAFYTFLVTGLIFWIIYFGYTPKWSPHFMLSFLMVSPALILVHNLSINATISAVELNIEKTAGIYFWEVPIEALYISFLVCYLSTLLYEWRRNKKST